MAEHFVQHRQKSNKISLLSFLYKHYCVAHDNDNDGPQDAELPFNNVHTSDFNPAFSIKPLMFPEYIITAEFIVEIKFPEQKPDGVICNFPEDIWQPPRCC